MARNIASMSRLEDAIEQLYAAFASVTKPKHIDGCRHCVTEEEFAKLLGTDLKELGVDKLDDYAFSAFVTVGDVPDYLYFLPRILHLDAMSDRDFASVEITGRAIATTDLISWPGERIEALEAFLMEVMESLLAPERHGNIDEWMCAIAKMGLDVRPYLSRIERSESAALKYFSDNAEGLPNRRLGNPFWELRSPGHAAIVEWFHSPKIKNLVFREYGVVLEWDSNEQNRGDRKSLWQRCLGFVKPRRRAC